MSNPIEIVKSFYTALGRGDVSSVLATLHPDLEWTEGERNGERVVSLGAYSGTFKTTGKSITAPFAHVWTVRDDRIARFIMYVDTMKVREAMR